VFQKAPGSAISWLAIEDGGDVSVNPVPVQPGSRIGRESGCGALPVVVESDTRASAQRLATAFGPCQPRSGTGTTSSPCSLGAPAQVARNGCVAVVVDDRVASTGLVPEDVLGQIPLDLVALHQIAGRR
jgi:hypothetical protein